MLFVTAVGGAYIGKKYMFVGVKIPKKKYNEKHRLNKI